nr:hypothetical protein CTI12_AA602910 [Tanacetum cinerariifolium]
SVAGPVKQRNEFSILERFQEFIDIGQAMGYKMKGCMETDTQEKDKNKAKNDKTEHKMEKIEKDKAVRSPRSIKVNPEKVKINPGKVKVNPDKAKEEK